MDKIGRLRALEKKWKQLADYAADDKWDEGYISAMNSAADDLSRLIAELGQEVGAVESFRGSLNSWIMAYPEQCFSEPQPEELFWLRDAKPGLLDRISASMGRHVAKCLITDFDAAFANFTSPAHTSEARDVLWTGWYHPDPEEQDDFMLYDAKDHRCDDCIRVHVVRAADDAAMRQECGSDA